MLEQNIKSIRETVENTNNGFNEKIMILGATKTRTIEEINEAVRLGVEDVGENKVQEFIDKTDGIDKNARQHFIGHLQTNKVKFLIGRIFLIQSGDRLSLFEEINKQSIAKNIKTNTLLQINIGREETKGGFFVEEVKDALEKISKMEGITLKGLMAMFPPKINEEEIKKFCLQMREIYDIIKKDNTYENFKFEYLSMGMSADYKTAIKYGSNLIRLGSAIFGERDYTKI